MGVIGDEPAFSSFGQHEQVEAGKDEVLCLEEAIATPTSEIFNGAARTN